MKCPNHQLEQTRSDPRNSSAGFRLFQSLGIRAPVAHLDRYAKS